MTLTNQVAPAGGCLTKYEHVREALRAQIRSGVYEPGARLPSEHELPHQMGVSIITVVRALNDLEQEGVIVRRHGKGSFVADPSQQPLVAGRELRLSILLPAHLTRDFSRCPAQHAMIDAALNVWGMGGIEPSFKRKRTAEASSARWVSARRACRVEALGEEPVARLHHPPLAAVRASRPDGILALSIIDEEWLEGLLDLGVPTVLGDFVSDRFAARADQVFYDPLPGYRAAVRTMVEWGVRRIHYVGCWLHAPYARRAAISKDPDFFSPAKARPDPDSLLRKAAWRLAMDEADLPCPAEWEHVTWFQSSQVRALAEELAAWPADRRPQAVVCHGIEQAEAFLDVFRERRIPLLAAGAAGGAHRHIAWPIHADHRRIGTIAAELLLRRIQQPMSFLRMGVPLELTDYVAVPAAFPRGAADCVS